MRESEWTRQLCRDMETHGALCIPMVAGEMTRPGIPDRLIIHSTFGMMLLEFKGAKTILSKIQKYTLGIINGRAPKSAWIVRHPNSIQDQNGDEVATFDGTGKHLLEVLTSLHKYA